MVETYSGMMMVKAAPTKIPMPSTDMDFSVFPFVSSAWTRTLTRCGRFEHQRKASDHDRCHEHADALQKQDQDGHGELSVPIAQSERPATGVG